jgi:hypothetical protein
MVNVLHTSLESMTDSMSTTRNGMAGSMGASRNRMTCLTQSPFHARFRRGQGRVGVGRRCYKVTSDQRREEPRCLTHVPHEPGSPMGFMLEGNQNLSGVISSFIVILGCLVTWARANLPECPSVA